MTSWSFARTPFLIAGPCVLEEGDLPLRVAEHLAELGRRLDVAVCFKASFDKANRARGSSPRGPGLEEGLDQLARIRDTTALPILTDIHEAAQARVAAEVVDALQIPAFLCRQTDLLEAAGGTALPVNIKKGQWAGPDTMAGAVEKVRGAGCTDVAVTERGTFFGYGDLVVDFRNLERLRVATGAAVVFDATHAVQQPGQGAGGTSAGLREHIPALLRAAAVSGADGFFLETHPDPARAPSDAATQWPLETFEALISQALDLWRRVRETVSA